MTLGVMPVFPILPCPVPHPSSQKPLSEAYAPPPCDPAELGPPERMEPAAALAACPVLIKAGRPAG